jgi:hypothetical protein
VRGGDRRTRHRGVLKAGGCSGACASTERLHINTSARHHSVQLAMLVPIVAALLGLLNALRMMRLPDPDPSASTEGLALG